MEPEEKRVQEEQKRCPECGGSMNVRFSLYPEGPAGVCGNLFHGKGTFWAGRHGS